MVWPVTFKQQILKNTIKATKIPKGNSHLQRNNNNKQTNKQLNACTLQRQSLSVPFGTKLRTAITPSELHVVNEGGYM